MIKKLLISFTFLFGSLALLAQNDPGEAVALYNEGKFEEAVVQFEKLYKKQPSEYYYTFLLNCYRELGQFEDAENVIKKRVRKSGDPLLWIDLGYFQKLENKEEEAANSFNEALFAINTNPGIAFPISEKFAKYGYFDLALKAYEVAEAISPSLRFNYQKGLIYAEMGDMENMYREYLELIDYSPNYYNNVKARIARNINDDPENKANAILKRQLIKRIQTTQNTLYNELLIWLYTEEMEYAKALRQLKALDKREGNRDSEIFNLGEKAAAKNEFFLAEECYSYVISKGELSGFYEDALFEKLNVSRKGLLSNPATTSKEYEKLVKEHYLVIEELEGTPNYVLLKANIASIEYFNLGNKDSAISILNNTISRFENTFKRPIAECKMLLGDILLAEGQSVDAIFKYMEVERAFSGTPIGDQAKFMKGMVAYYTADFPWALNQFEVLKSSTTKLISNDALQMALLISDNSTEDTLYQGLTYYAKADLYTFRNMPDSALYQVNLLLDVFPDHKIVAEATLLKAGVLDQKGMYTEAIKTLENLLENKKGDIWTDDALMQLGELYANRLGDVDLAMKAYETILFEHPGSTFVPEARRRYRKLRGDNLEN